jgi:hypothetical protein
VILGFLKQIGRPSGTLSIAGLLIQDEVDDGSQTAAYKSWLKDSIKITGKLSEPTDEEVDKYLSTHQFNNSFKKDRTASRIANILRDLPPLRKPSAQKKQR